LKKNLPLQLGYSGISRIIGDIPAAVSHASIRSSFYHSNYINDFYNC